MATIRKQAITSSLLLYLGFAIGALNIYLYTKNGAFTKEQFGLTRLFFDFSTNIYAFGSLGAIAVIYRFYPYYKDNLPQRENDLITWVLCASLLGFLIVLGIGIEFQDYIIRKFSRGSQLFLDYYFWIFPFGLGLLMFSVMESFAWILQKTVIHNFLKETVLRVLTSALIVLYYLKVVSFSGFVHLFAMLYLAIFVILLVYIVRQKKFFLCFKISRVTRKFWKKMLMMQGMLFGGLIITAIGQTVDSWRK